MTPPRVSDERLANSIKTSRVPAAATFILDCIKDLRDARAEIVRLNATQEREVRQFNAGHDAAEKHEGPLPRNTFDPSPNDHTGPDGMFEPDEDTWRIGFAFGAYDALARERDALAERVRALREAGQRVLDIAEQEKLPSFACFQELEELLAASPAATETRTAPRTCPECGAAWFGPGEMTAWQADRLALMEAGVRAGNNVPVSMDVMTLREVAARVLVEHDKRKEGTGG